MKGKRVVTILFIAVIAVLGATLARVSAQGTSECDQSPFCEVLSPFDSGSYTAPGDITKFIIKTGSSVEDKKIVFTPPGGIDPDGCWNVVINGPVVDWNRLENSSVCQDPSAFEVWWNENPTNTFTPSLTSTETATNTPTDTATVTNTPTNTLTATVTSTGTINPTNTPTKVKYTSTPKITDPPKTLTPTPEEPLPGGKDPRKSIGIIPLLVAIPLVSTIGGLLIVKRRKIT